MSLKVLTSIKHRLVTKSKILIYLEIYNLQFIPHTLCFPPTSSHKKCSIKFAKETFENKFFKETAVTFTLASPRSYFKRSTRPFSFGRNQSSSYITPYIIVQIDISNLEIMCIAVGYNSIM